MTKRIAIYALAGGLIFPFTQVARGQQADPVQPPQSGAVAQNSSGGPSASDVANANNPIAPMNAIFFQNYYAPTVYGTPGPNNLLDLRTLTVSGRQIVRTTLPISSSGNTNDNQPSGLGDFNIFDAFKLTPPQSRNVLATGPLLVAPTATNSNLGQGKWQAGVAAIDVYSVSPGSLLIGIFNWQHSFAGEHSRPEAQSVVFQPIAALAIGGGYYFRSSGVWTFDIANDKALIPLGVGFGKVFKVHNVIVNAALEPQFTLYHNGTGQPSFQLYSGLYFLFPKKN
ncbi:MAG: hypothetical protein ABSA39_02775 [Edaphobacter sp.]